MRCGKWGPPRGRPGGIPKQWPAGTSSWPLVVRPVQPSPTNRRQAAGADTDAIAARLFGQMNLEAVTLGPTGGSAVADRQEALTAVANFLMQRIRAAQYTSVTHMRLLGTIL